MPAVDDFKNLNKLDQVVLGAGVLGLIVSLFFPIWGVSVNVKGFGGGSSSINAWHGLAAFGMLLVLLATVIAGVRVFAAANLPTLPIGVNLLTFALSAVGTVIVIIRELTYPHASLPGYSYGVRWGGYLLFLLLIAQAVAAFLLWRASGEAMPDFKAMGNRTSNPAVPPAYGSTPPPPTGAPTTTYPTTPSGDYKLEE